MNPALASNDIQISAALLQDLASCHSRHGKRQSQKPLQLLAPAPPRHTGQPTSDAELESRVRKLTDYSIPFVDAVGLISAVLGNEGEADPTRLMRLIIPA
jgi:hypothetical protein